MGVLTTVKRLLRAARPMRRVPRCLSMKVRSEDEVRQAAQELAAPATLQSGMLQTLIRELVALNTPALFLNVVQRGGPVRVVLRPWDGRSVQFRGRNYVVDVGAGPANAVEEFERTPAAHVTSLYPASPDHLLYVVSIEHQGTLVHTGEFPAYLTHLTLLMNGVVTARCERLLHERGTQVFWSDLVPRTRAVG